MQLIKSVLAVAAVAGSVASADLISFDAQYLPGFQTLIGSCSDGSNGLAGLFPTWGNIPNYPFVGSYNGVAGWNSPECGQCFKISTPDKSIYVTAADTKGAGGWDLTHEALMVLGGQAAVDAGGIEATTEKVARNLCGFA